MRGDRGSSSLLTCFRLSCQGVRGCASVADRARRRSRFPSVTMTIALSATVGVAMARAGAQGSTLTWPRCNSSWPSISRSWNRTRPISIKPWLLWKIACQSVWTTQGCVMTWLKKGLGGLRVDCRNLRSSCSREGAGMLRGMIVAS